jgi:hypothetical protein
MDWIRGREPGSSGRGKEPVAGSETFELHKGWGTTLPSQRLLACQERLLHGVHWLGTRATRCTSFRISCCFLLVASSTCPTYRDHILNVRTTGPKPNSAEAPCFGSWLCAVGKHKRRVAQSGVICMQTVNLTNIYVLLTPHAFLPIL